MTQPAPGRIRVVEVDVAPVVLSSATGRPSGLVSWEAPAGKVTAGWDGSGRPSLEVDQVLVTGDEPLVAGEWTRFAVVVDPDRVVLHVEGEPVAAHTGLPDSDLAPCRDGLVLGTRQHAEIVEDTFDAETAVGEIGPVRAWAEPECWTPTAYDGPAEPLDLVTWLAGRAAPDHQRPGYHFAPPAAWMNEPHAPLQVGGRHHLFFQANRRGPFWGGIEWGHAVSDDLVHWSHQPPALTPGTSPVAPDGVWSGSSVRNEDGDVLLFVTAGDRTRTPDQAVAVARPCGDGWVLDPDPVVAMPEDPELVTGQFRDPFVWREDGRWFMLVGAGVRDVGGTALLFTSPDARNWAARGRLLVGDLAMQPESGEMWELPVLLPVKTPFGSTRHVLLVCTWWTERPHDQIVQVLHWVGTWDPATATFEPDHPEGRLFDHGRHFTGPSGYRTSDGRTVLWSIAQDGRDAATRARTGWAHNAGLPLELGLDDTDRLTVRPVRELTTLRQELLVEVADPHLFVPVALGHQVELAVTADGLDQVAAVILGLFTDDAASPRATLTIAHDQVALHRPGAARYDHWCGDERVTGPLPPGPLHEVRVFIDGSMLEVFVDDLISLTSRVCAPPSAQRVTLAATGDTAVQLRAWRLEAAAPTVTSAPASSHRQGNR